ncbi:longitudinals lacking protein, isoforms F/I/K/T isoform X4 [Bombyx mori]|uniref:Longitudinals lacking protein n=1 Tax=Bombyx mori TaxID=7091 RepID=A0A8R2LYK7_BOMMO|nr:longitudinals lacking protein, isoforms F/I/K/T isoform X4 [Bombyx mori]
MDDDQQFCLRWNNHQSTLVSVFDTLLEKGMHVDCTLAAEGQTLKAHKVVLSACSPYFESVLSQQYDKHPIIILKDVKYAELRAMMDYMYRGEVNISQDQLAALLKAAESLQIKGLSDNKPSRPPSRPQPTAPAPAVPATAPPAPPAPLVPPLAARTASPAPLGRDASPDSREGSLSPSRRRKKARRGSGAAHNGASPPPPPAPLKDELSRADTLEDLTLDDEHHDDAPPPSHNDVVRNFQWHMERSQDEIMNSSDNAREQQEAGKALPPALLSLLSVQRALQLEYDDTDDIVLSDEPPPAEPARQFECRHCGKRYRWKSTLRRHENVECGGKAPAHQCPHCAYRAKQRGNLGVHIRKHHTAEWCLYAGNKMRPGSTGGGEDVSFSRIGGLSWEQWSARLALPLVAGVAGVAGLRTPDPGFACPDCGRLYKLKSSLRNHQKWECGKEPQFQCPYCVYRAKQKMHIARHMERMHRDLHLKPDQYIKQDNVDACT